jgi:hypothetical protein
MINWSPREATGSYTKGRWTVQQQARRKGGALADPDTRGESESCHSFTHIVYRQHPALSVNPGPRALESRVTAHIPIHNFVPRCDTSIRPTTTGSRSSSVMSSSKDSAFPSDGGGQDCVAAAHSTRDQKRSRSPFLSDGEETCKKGRCSETDKELRQADR